MDINVLKFGGTSMADHKTWKQVLEIIKTYEYPVVVVSATARTTRQLVESGRLAAEGKLEEANTIVTDILLRHQTIVLEFLKENPHAKHKLIQDSCFRNMDAKIHKLKKLLEYTHKTGELSPKMHDAICSMGEQISSYLLAQCGLALDMMTQHVEARKLIKTDQEYGKANPNMFKITQHCGSLETILESGFTPIIGGFYGEAPDKTITTLGFEGSDYSASLIGGAINAETIEIWTDVSGVFSTDPRYIPEAKPLSEMSYFEATELAYFGAKVLHPSTLKPAQEKNIPVLVKNMFEPDAKGTRIHRDSTHDLGVLALSFKENMVTLTISAYETVMGYSFLTKVFSILEQHRLPVAAVNTTEASVTIALSGTENLEKLNQHFIELGTVTQEQEKGLISLIGCTVNESEKLTRDILGSIGNVELDLISFSKEKRILNLVLDQEYLIDTVRNLHQKLFD